MSGSNYHKIMSPSSQNVRNSCRLFQNHNTNGIRYLLLIRTYPTGAMSSQFTHELLKVGHKSGSWYSTKSNCWYFTLIMSFVPYKIYTLLHTHFEYKHVYEPMIVLYILIVEYTQVHTVQLVFLHISPLRIIYCDRKVISHKLSKDKFYHDITVY